MDLLVSNLIGFIIGLFTSWVFFKWQLSVKPRLLISEYALYSTKRHNFRMKIANDGNHQVTDIRARLCILKRREYEGQASQFMVCELPLKNDTQFALAERKDRGKPWGLLYTRVFVSESNSEAYELLHAPTEEERRLVFTIEAVDAISGTKVVKRVAYRYEDIKVDFKFGNKFEIVQSQDEPAVDTPVIEQ